MNSEIDLPNTYETDVTVYHVEMQKDLEGRDVEVEVYDVPLDVRIAMAVARLTRRVQRAGRL
jgi:hypothetical protein